MASNRPSSDRGDGPPLSDRLKERITNEGPLTFHDFMEAALYDPHHGFYSRGTVGEEGEFVTSPHISPVFGILLAAQVEEFWNLLGRPDPFSVIEVGSGDGTLAGQILDALPASIRGATRYTATERSATARRALGSLRVDVASSLSEVEGPVVGCMLANELLDNLPFHRLRRTERKLVELYVDVGQGGFIIREGPLSRPDLAPDVPDLSSGEEWPVRPSVRGMLDEASRILPRGYVWLADYGLRGGGSAASVHGYRRHRLEEDVLEAPGSRDITAGVDFDSLARLAKQRAMTVWGPVTQRDALISLGFRHLDRRAQARQVEAVQERMGIDALRIYSNRTRANLLLGKGGLGDFSVMCLGIGVTGVPKSFRTERESLAVDVPHHEEDAAEYGDEVRNERSRE